VIQRRTAVAVAALAATLSMLAACGFEAPTVEDHEQASVQATDFTVGAVRLDDTSITAASAATTDGSAPQFYLVVTIVNGAKATNTLKSVTTTQGTITLAGAGTTNGTIALLPGVPVEIGVPAPGTGTPGTTLAVTASPAPQTGAFVPVTFSFTNGDVSPTIQVPVIPAGETTAATQPVPTATASVPTEVGDSADD
jgi:hypothetical protein